MELRQLRYFAAVADELHFGRAAEKLHVVQPAVSQQVARLERELGVRLFDRSPRRVRLTVAGTRLLAEARAVLAAADRTSAVAAELAEASRTTMRISASPGLGPRLERALLALREASGEPEARVELVSVPIPDQVAAVARGEVDVALVRAARPTPGVRVVELWREPLWAAMPAWFEAAPRPAVALAALADLRLRIPSEACDPFFRAFVLRACRSAGFEPWLGRPSGSVQDTLLEIGAGRPAAMGPDGPTWTVLHAEAARDPAAALRSVTVRPIDPPLDVPGCLVVAEAKPRACVEVLTAAFAD
ncbi:LysR family transcriptional regulator [Frankia sp. CNm7]|uniref:LysR family transcriptional regulator n=1 Tax=Frankia nepalensis TaxID=1836974 RepID=UPI0019313767|nr:LysR family transcriptional regulator [Frankia nepalensis]MBL7495104.1 LysR family transcriptional regulator [Frankia nepalensis]MBL7515395.1 LysR family transcriptional regulator [Frankia nepalensis]MBL7518849.1 LysR family transcriptional regulator [Frankia nepalensis]